MEFSKVDLALLGPPGEQESRKLSRVNSSKQGQSLPTDRQSKVNKGSPYRVAGPRRPSIPGLGREGGEYGERGGTQLHSIGRHLSQFCTVDTDNVEGGRGVRLLVRFALV